MTDERYPRSVGRQNLKFKPPPVALNTPIRWVLARAFGPEPMSVPLAADGEECARLAWLFALAPRIASRHAESLLENELGAEPARSLQKARAFALTTELRRDLAVEVVERVSRRIDLPVALLKSCALRRRGIVASGHRAVTDADVLVPWARRWELHGALEAEGFESLRLPESEFHLPQVSRAAEGPIEIHTKIVGVRDAESRGSFGFDDLMGRDLLEREESGLFVPSVSVLAAHAAVHGLVQHGNQPDAYPLALVFGDLLDLGFGHGDRRLADSAGRFVVRYLAASEIEAVEELCKRLLLGAYAESQELRLDDPPDRLLAHCLAGRLDKSYAERLKLAWLQPRLSDRSYPSTLVRTFVSSLFPSRERLRVAYGDTAAGASSAPLRARWLSARIAGLGRAVAASRHRQR